MDVNETEVFVKIQKKNIFFGGGGRWGGRGEGGGSGWGSGSGWRVRVDVNEELKFSGKNCNGQRNNKFNKTQKKKKKELKFL